MQTVPCFAFAVLQILSMKEQLVFLIPTNCRWLIHGCHVLWLLERQEFHFLLLVLICLFLLLAKSCIVFYSYDTMVPDYRPLCLKYRVRVSIYFFSESI